MYLLRTLTNKAVSEIATDIEATLTWLFFSETEFSALKGFIGKHWGQDSSVNAYNYVLPS